MESTTLYFREGSSDKVYQASIQPKDEGFMVYFAYGRRGSTLSTGSKTPNPVPHDQAKSIYDRLVKEKMSKGYALGSDAPTYQHTDTIKKHSGIQCQLLNPVPEHRLSSLLDEREHWLQEKMDGRRLLIKKTGTSITGINRLGIEVAVPEPIVESALKYRGDFILDGEAIGETLHAFDLLWICGEDLRPLRYSVRYFRLRDLLYAFEHPHVKRVESYCFPEKREWFNRFKENGSEGVVFKDVDSIYIPGRPNVGGSQLKHKFYETASFIVEKVNDKRSVSLSLFEAGQLRSAGNVTIPPNQDIPSPGSVVECRYLYAFKESGCIYQPVFLGVRDDINAKECITTQLKYKAEVVIA